MVKIRLARFGAKKQPFYYFHVTDSRMPLGGRYIERLGYFNPLARGAEKRIQLDLERTEHWLGQGAQMTERVKHLWQQAQHTDTAVSSPKDDTVEVKKPKDETAKTKKVAQKKSDSSK